MNIASIILFAGAAAALLQMGSAGRHVETWDKDNVVFALVAVGMATLASVLFALERGWL